MSADKGPRQYKFVGAYSRKRRRRDTPLGEGAVSLCRQLRTSTITTDTPATATAISHGMIEQQESQTDGPILAAIHVAQTTSPLVNADLIAQENANPDDNLVLLPSCSPVNEHINQASHEDWSYSTFINPLFDPSFSPTANFNPLHTQVPMQLGHDATLMQTEDNSSPDDSVEHSSDYPVVTGRNEAVVDSAENTGVVLLLPNQIACNRSFTLSDLVTRYDKEYCVMPLTHDFDANPFRFDSKSYQDSELLFHSILALSYKHINRETGSCAEEARTYKNNALQMLHATETVSKNSVLSTTILDAVLILMTLDCATSAHGPWTWYLKRAYQIMQTMGSLHMEATPRMRARLEMLVWWDVTLGLTSRQGFVLSESAIIELFSHDKSKNETFYDVSGCPEALFRHMIRLGSYARELELVSGMTCVKFNMEPVLEVEKQIREWRDPDYEDRPEQYDFTLSSDQICDIEKMAQYKEDLHHCAEAWRYSLLIYIGRVFRWQRDQPAQPILGFLARKTLRHVTCCRYTSQLQKQLLLPVFLAGCETEDEHLREIALSYCKWWSERTKYDMFLTTHSLLQEFWSDETSQTWWGDFLDKKTKSNGGSKDSRQYLFG